MEDIKQNKLLTFYHTIKSSQIIAKINQFICSFWGLFTIACITFVSFALSLELVMYSLVCLYTIYICLFAKDFLPLMTLFIFCYVAPSASNNPGNNAKAVFYGAGGIAILVIAGICAIAILLRIGLDKNMSFKKLFTQKLSLTISMLVLGLAYCLSGIFCDIYSKVWLNNIIFALLQFLSIFLLYFILAATIDWKSASKDYLPFTAILMGFVVCLEVVYLYIFKTTFKFGELSKAFIVTGWGISNNIAAMITMAVPFAFYFAYKKKNTYLYLSIATLFMLAITMTLSRASFLTALVIYAICFFICFFKAENKKAFRITSAIILGIILVASAIFYKQIWDLFLEVLQIFEKNEKGDLVFADANRFVTYELGLEFFADFPIFGKSFFARDFWPYQYSTVESFTSFFPARWHNTIIQLLASTGSVGLIAYLYHRAKTIILIVKKPTYGKTFIGLSILSLIFMSMLDNHFFNIGPVLFYSIMLIFAEKLYTEDKEPETQNITALQEDISTDTQPGAESAPQKTPEQSPKNNQSKQKTTTKKSKGVNKSKTITQPKSTKKQE